ncbi:MAG TPA: S9 family peptidase [Thermoanaerobaculia bacterium]|nr:S9 family peptidase [Thermoanaerobaculia bacterium]HUM29791.1 S9 family peptidase [Thermoanaerobaculia bacterium]HXK68066.1 S9 family peptidase [Thermoanaerobaculia bacterium]
MRNHRFTLLFLAFSLIAACTLQAAEKRAFTIPDLYSIQYLSDLQISPDGTELAFTVSEYDLPRAKRTSAIWLMNTDGSNLRKFTSGEALDRTPRWSPDGKTLAFTSTREKSTQLYVIPRSGGEARCLAKLTFGASDPVWSPDGRFIVVASDLYPECGPTAECNDKRKKDADEGPSQAHLADSLLYRHWDDWKDGKRTHLIRIDMEGGLTDLTPGDWDSPEFSLGGSRYGFTPDGSAFYFTSKRVDNPAESTNVDIWRIGLKDPETMKAQRLTTNPAYDGQPVISPDGTRLAFLTQTIPGYEADLFRLAILDLASKKVRLLTDLDSFDNWINHVEWSKDGRELYATAQVEGDTPFYRVDIESVKFTKIFTHEAIDSFILDPSETHLFYIHRSVGEPTEIYVKDLKKDTAPKRLTSFSERLLQEVDVRPAERMWIKGADGKELQVFLVKPHGFDPSKKYPLILNVHGGPQMMWQDSFRGDWQVYPGAGYIVAFPNPHGSTGYGQEYCAEISGDWGGKVYEDVLKVTDYLASLPYVDAERIGAMGWSYGGYMMDWILGHTDRYQCLASMMGVYDLRSMYGATEELWFPEWDLKGTPWDSEQYATFSPSFYASSFKTPTLVISGEKDFRVPYTQSLQLFTALQKQGVPSRLIIFKNSGHWPSWWDMILYYTAHLEWFQTYLGGDGPPWSVKDFVANRVFDTETGKRLDLEAP